MESTNPILPEDVPGTQVDWKTQMTDEYRQLSVNKICEYMMKNSSGGPQDETKYRNFASKFEQKIFSIATSKADYWGKIKARTQALIRARQPMPRSSAPGTVYPVEGSIHQVMEGGTSQAIYPVVDDWKEQVYNQLQNLKNLFQPVLEAKCHEISEMLMKMKSVPQQQWPADYESLQRQFVKYENVCKLLNYSKDQISEGLRRSLPQFENYLHNLLQDRSGGLISSSHQNQHPTSDGVQSSRHRVPAEREDRPLQKRHRIESLTQYKEQWGLQLHQQSGDLQAPHSSQVNQAISEEQIQAKRVEIENFLLNNSEGDCLPSNQQLVNSIPVSTSYNSGDVLPKATCGAQLAKTLPPGLLAESATIIGKQSYSLGTGPTGSSVPEEPIQRLIKAVRSMSRNASDACVDDMESVLRMVDGTAGQVSGNGSKFAVGEDLAAASTRYGLKQNFSSQSPQRNLYATSFPIHFSEPIIISGNAKHVTDPEASPLESSIATHDKKSRFKETCNLLEEIKEINMHLIETVIEITQRGLSGSGEGTIVECSYTPVAIRAKMKVDLVMSQVPPIMTLRLLVPVNYPAHSPEILDKLPSEISVDCEDLSVKAISQLKLSLRNLHQPISLKDVVRTWDTCVRAVLTEFVQNLGGGSFSSTYGTWKELCFRKAYYSGA